MRGRRFTDDGSQVAGYFYVDKALNPRGSGEGEFSVETVDENTLTASNLRNKSVVVWTDPLALDRKRFELLKRYIHSGGSVMVFLGGGRKGFWQDSRFADYLGIQKVVAKEADNGRFASFQKEHPIFSIFNKEELELLSTGRVRRHLSVSGINPDSVLAYLGSGDPGIWECRRGNGRILVVATSPDLSGGDLPLSPMFLPLIHTSVSFLASAEGSDFHRENYAGDDLFFDLPAGWNARSTNLRVVDENGAEREPAFYESPQGDVRVMLTRPRTVGFYKLLADTTMISQSTVNVDTGESSLNAHPLDASYLGHANVVETSSDFIENLQREKQGREIYAIFLLLAVSALVAESILGRKA